jgi:lysophospholipase L1-like esterase
MRPATIAVLCVLLCGCNSVNLTPVAATNLASQKKAVFLGDSITSYWNLSSQFPGTQLINKGIQGDPTSDMLRRFDVDVIQLQPQVVVILGGTNDIVRRLATQDQSMSNMQAMISKAQAAGIQVVIGTLPPVARNIGSLGYGNQDFDPLIASYNQALNSLDVPIADYHQALAGPDGLPISGVLRDGVHPTQDGYNRMASVIAPMI